MRIREVVGRDGGEVVRRVRVRREVWVVREVRGVGEGWWGEERRWEVQWRRRMV